MVAHCLTGLPDEACGLLGGDLENGEAVTCYPTRNLAASAKLYTVDPAEHLRADRDAEAAGHSIIGVFHSHTHTEAYPSPTDVAQAPDPELALRGGLATGRPAGGAELPDRRRGHRRGTGRLQPR
jgi:proteasome lid subunit RPN8/RPN11